MEDSQASREVTPDETPELRVLLSRARDEAEAEELAELLSCLPEELF